MCAAALSDPDARTQFWTHVLDLPVTSFKQLMASETFAKQYQQEDMKKQVLYHIDNFIGNGRAVFLLSPQGSFLFLLLCFFFLFIIAIPVTYEEACVLFDVCNSAVLPPCPSVWYFLSI